MVEKNIVDRIRRAIKRPDSWSRLAEAQQRAAETNSYLHKAAQLPPNWKDWRVTI